MDKLWLPGQLATVQLVLLPRPSHISRGDNSRYLIWRKSRRKVWRSTWRSFRWRMDFNFLFDHFNTILSVVAGRPAGGGGGGGAQGRDPHRELHGKDTYCGGEYWQCDGRALRGACVVSCLEFHSARKRPPIIITLWMDGLFTPCLASAQPQVSCSRAGPSPPSLI